MSLTPMLKQYQSIRKTLPRDTILFFRLGDFYEMFYEDAKRSSSILDITLTARDGGNNNKVPMCGVPYHSAQGYINRLTRSGLKVAICEQVEDPKLVKGIVKREIVRVISPATNLEDDAEQRYHFNYLAAFYVNKCVYGCACLDLSTGDFRIGEFKSVTELEDELIRLQPCECVVPAEFKRNSLKNFFAELSPTVNEYEGWIFEYEQSKTRILEHFNVASLASFGIEEFSAGISCAGALLYYLSDNLHKSLEHLKKPVAFQNTQFMFLDKQTIKNLDLTRSSSGDKMCPTLYSVLDRTITPMGARLLSQWITQPLLLPEEICKRQDAVEELFANPDLLQRLQEHLKPIKDLERLLARINCGTPSARDMVALGNSLECIPALKQTISCLTSVLFSKQLKNIFELHDLATTIGKAFVEGPPPGIKEGGFIKDGYSTELDEARYISRNAKEWIVTLQKKESQKTGIKSLKVRYNKIFGYYIDITKPNLHMVPDYYIRKQTLVNSERFIVPELKEYEEKILGAEETARELECRIFEDIRRLVLQYISEIQSTADAVAVLDVLFSLASVALSNNYCKPKISDGSVIHIAGGRHPVVEHTLDGEQFIDNDVLLDIDDNQLLIITGPNMAGKSTFIRQVALLVLMAQTGSFIPARIANIGVVDRVFSRIGASDNLAKGESTFMVEMIETANILLNATSQSLLVFDEIGRGTSTFDGVSIAWSVCEYINQKHFRPKCLFATHYHELTELSDQRRGIKNYNVTVKEIEDTILFLRKVIPGGADKSYGIHVGKLAGLPQEIIERAAEILLCLEEEKISEGSIREILKKKKGTVSVYDLPLFKPLKEQAGEKVLSFNAIQKALANHPLLKEIKDVEINSLTPLEALMKIAQWQKDLSANDFASRSDHDL